MVEDHPSIERCPIHCGTPHTHQDYSKLVKERKLIERWKLGGILNYIKKFYKSNFYNLAIDLTSTIPRKKLNLQRKVMNTNLHTMKSEEMFNESPLSKKEKKGCKL